MLAFPSRLSSFPLRAVLLAPLAAAALGMIGLEEVKASTNDALRLPTSNRATATAGSTLQDSPKVVLDQAWQIVNREYVDDHFNHTDWQATRQRLLGQEYSSPEAAYNALRAALRQLNDPYTRFLSPTEYSDLTDQTAGEVSGIGVQVQRNDNRVVITAITPGSPAEQAGLVVGDHLVMVDGQSTSNLTAEGVNQRLRGAENSQVTLSVARNGGTPRSIIVTRARMEMPAVEYTRRTVGGRPIGYIRLMEFNAHAAEQMERAILSLTQEGVEGFVLDLRGNPGGLLFASIDIGRMWLQHGPIVRTVYRDGTTESLSANRTALTQLPLTVLVDRRSASSSEILTGALQDNRRATVVGTPTFGKALVQTLHGLSDGSGLTVTVAHYFTPNGTDISRKGITPDVTVELNERQRSELFANPSRLGTDTDPQFVRAAEVLEQTIIARQSSQGPRQLGQVQPTEP
ncbi:S41 family peptidase [Phormidium sp. FACHB-1136]|jgi:carboxyl-terminal processing protease|uniref:S41 family peptidase n=1 Tax=Phormidium sp. FACHB-1136 TaxID=2692848 RepID=UPI0018F03FDB|nr:S41 family peptidase [Phormidium sp. FACHB-1136]